MGRDAAGVRGIMLTDGDYVVGAEKAEEGKTLLTVTQNGYGKRTALTEYLRTGPNGEKQAQSRGGKGLKNYNITPKTGNVAGCRVVSESDDVMLIETAASSSAFPRPLSTSTSGTFRASSSCALTTAIRWSLWSVSRRWTRKRPENRHENRDPVH